jgi:tRNA(fMet)-specific endonuclease VapC
MNPCLLDTDILSEVMRGRNQDVVAKADLYLQSHGQFAISAFTQYEVVRGLRWRKASIKLAEFLRLCDAMTVYPITADILDRAADLWASGAALGKPKMDADLVIAATALVNGRELVTGNLAHFEWIEGLVLSSWRKP